jgi:hypothetical protein
MNSPQPCPTCGELVAPGAAFCRACGARQGQSCAQCGAPTVPGAAFCRSCGMPVAGAVPPSEPTQQTEVKAVAPPTVTAADNRSWRTPLLIAGAVLLLGAGAAAAIFLVGGGEGSSTTVASRSSIAEEGSASEEAATAESAEADVNGLPPIGRGEMEEEIRALLVDYHGDVVNREFRSAWGLLSSRKRQQDLAEYGYAEWQQAQATLSPYLSPGGLRAQIEGVEGDGVVRVEVTGMGWSAPGSNCLEWSGLTWAKYEGGAWTYDPGYSTTAARRRAWQPRADELLGAGC